MKKKQVLAVSSALMIGTTTALTGLPTPVMAQENTEVVQEAVVEENKTEQVPVEQKTENAEVQENITDKEQEETAENAETLKEESTKQETPATPEKEVVTEDMILSILVYTFFSRMFDLMLPPVAKHSIVVA